MCCCLIILPRKTVSAKTISEAIWDWRHHGTLCTSAQRMPNAGSRESWRRDFESAVCLKPLLQIHIIRWRNYTYSCHFTSGLWICLEGINAFLPPKSKISLNCLSFGKSKQWPQSLQYLAASNSCIMISICPLVAIFHTLMSNTCRSKKRNKSAAEQCCHWNYLFLWGGEDTGCSESTALIPVFLSLGPRAG